MPKLIILGTSNAIPSEEHENTHLAIVGEKHKLLVDCVSNPVTRLPRAGIDFNTLTDLVLTHFHPDHVSGVPLLLVDMWLLGRRTPLNIYGLHHTLDRMEDLMGFYQWESWPNFFPVAFYRLPQEDMTQVMDNEEFRVWASPVRHLIPTIGLRIEFKGSGKSMAYSCDTEPCPQVVQLAEGADVLVHESAGASTGHSSAAQAGEIARLAEVRSLYLIHYQTHNFDPGSLIDEARRTFQGELSLAKDFMVLEF